MEELLAKRMVLEANLEDANQRYRAKKEEAVFFRQELANEEEIAKLIGFVPGQAPSSDALVIGAREIMQLEEKGLEFILKELLEIMQERHQLTEELKGLGHSLPQ
jgi:hypothetical protein